MIYQLLVLIGMGVIVLLVVIAITRVRILRYNKTSFENQNNNTELSDQITEVLGGIPANKESTKKDS